MAEAFCEPAYGVRSLGDLVPAAAHALGSPLGPAPTGLTLPDAQSYVVFLIDGLGARLLERYAHAAPYLSSLLAGSTPATAGVPSTTSTSLTSLGTGLAPGAHGLVGFTTRIPGTSDLLNALLWDHDVEPTQWQPHTTAFSSLQAAGVRVTVVNKREFDGSGLTVAAHRGADYVGVDRVGERIAAVVAASRPGPRQPTLTYVYDGDLDWTGHRWGVASSQWLQRTRDDRPRGRAGCARRCPRTGACSSWRTTAWSTSPTTRASTSPPTTSSRDGVAIVGGEARFRHLYCTGGAVADVVATWREVVGGRADVLTRAEAIGRGWFGAVDPSVLPRIGDVVVACRGDFAVLSTDGFPYEARLIGMHGSLTPDEMLIPVLLD
ncbi:alkaline phosphatase family protein [Nocardioides convexus]|uniref:alkaline phosphatase family protein n=1 Tax=Nocardioides convexus TaxID=2712224 RepID=UPI0024185695|nr:alkaline phosphatase family protein [Nocardioides convexus]